MKICNDCKLEKSLENYSKYKNSKDGLCYICKECSNKKTRIWYINNRERNHERTAKWWAKNRKRKLKEGLERKDRYLKNNPKKRKAHIKITNAIALGKIKKEPCVVCKKFYKKNSVAQAHHEDYSKPLNVVWLCRKHHSSWHRLFIAII